MLCVNYNSIKMIFKKNEETPYILLGNELVRGGARYTIISIVFYYLHRKGEQMCGNLQRVWAESRRAHIRNCPSRFLRGGKLCSWVTEERGRLSASSVPSALLNFELLGYINYSKIKSI